MDSEAQVPHYELLGPLIPVEGKRINTKVGCTNVRFDNYESNHSTIGKILPTLRYYDQKLIR
jgi:hypothetical protein